MKRFSNVSFDCQSTVEYKNWAACETGVRQVQVCTVCRRTG